MAFCFNPIAFASYMDCAADVVMAGAVVARTLRSALSCPCCGAAYNLLVPLTASPSDVEACSSDLRMILRQTCGDHPPVVQAP
jgi:transposase